MYENFPKIDGYSLASAPEYNNVVFPYISPDGKTIALHLGDDFESTKSDFQDEVRVLRLDEETGSYIDCGSLFKYHCKENLDLGKSRVFPYIVGNGLELGIQFLGDQNSLGTRIYKYDENGENYNLTGETSDFDVDLDKVWGHGSRDGKIRVVRFGSKLVVLKKR